MSRTSVQGILRQVGDVLDQDLPEPTLQRRLGRLVELLWQTDEIRPGREVLQLTDGSTCCRGPSTGSPPGCATPGEYLSLFIEDLGIERLSVPHHLYC